MSLLEYKPEKNAPKNQLQVTKVGRAFIAAKANIRKHYKK
jgi:hypothetical protein